MLLNLIIILATLYMGYNVVKDAGTLQKVVDPYGSYLYKNYTATPVQL